MSRFGPVDIGIVIALTEEFLELRDEIKRSIQYPNRTGSYDYYFEHVGAAIRPHRCVATFAGGMGGVKAALVAQRLIHDWQPSTVVVLGIAAGISDDVKIGDVVVATEVDSYLQNVKAVDNKNRGFKFELAGESFRTSKPLVNKVESMRADGTAYTHWSTSCGSQLKHLITALRFKRFAAAGVFRKQPEIVAGHIASGPAVAASQYFVEWLKKSINRKYVALEMETAGVLEAVEDFPDVRSLVLRGISDRGDDQKAESDKAGEGVLRRYAMQNSIRLLWSLLDADKIPLNPDIEQDAQPQPLVQRFTSTSRIPVRPNPYVAHRYSLLSERGLVGRHDKKKELTNWAKGSKSKNVVLNVVAPGGMGKSALTWEWFNDVVPKDCTHIDRKPMAGRMWWSFYQPEATFESFVRNALAYTTGVELETLANKSSEVCQMELLVQLRKLPFLIVLDGLERLLLSNNSLIPPHQAADVERNEATPTPVEDFLSLLTEGKKCASRVLTSTRIYPRAMEKENQPIPRSDRIDLRGLSDGDALELWKPLRTSGSEGVLTAFFNRIGHHPLLIYALASKIATDHSAANGFQIWWDLHPKFANPGLKQVKSHVMSAVMEDLSDTETYVLLVIADFRRPVEFDTLLALLIGEGESLCADRAELEQILERLEGRGLLGCDRGTDVNFFDLHPIVRGVVWSQAKKEVAARVDSSLCANFEAMPSRPGHLATIEDLSPRIQVYYDLIEHEFYDAAFAALRPPLDKSTLFRLDAGEQWIHMLRQLFPDGSHNPPHLATWPARSQAITALASAINMSGNPNQAWPMYKSHNDLAKHNTSDIGRALGLLATTERFLGHLQSAIENARQGLKSSQDSGKRLNAAKALYRLGAANSARGNVVEAKNAFKEAEAIVIEESSSTVESKDLHRSEILATIRVHEAQLAIWEGDPRVDSVIESARQTAHEQQEMFEMIRAARLEAMAVLISKDGGRPSKERLDYANERLDYALEHSHKCHLIEERIPALIWSAELFRQQAALVPPEMELEDALRRLDEALALASIGEYRLFIADAHNIRAQIMRDQGDEKGAIMDARQAFGHAKCDGDEFTYRWGIERAWQHFDQMKVDRPKESADIRFPGEPDRWAARLRQLGLRIRGHLRGIVGSDVDRLAEPVAQEGGDAIYVLDRDVEDVLLAEVEAWSEPLLLIAEGLGSDGRRKIGSDDAEPRYRLIVDPIDGTRSLMYDKRSAWFLAAIAEDHGEQTSLSQAFAAAMVELPTSKQAWADDFSAAAGQGVQAWRCHLERDEEKTISPRPSSATKLTDGFAQVSNFFPGTKVLAAQLMERIVEATLGQLRPGSADVFDDQYISTGGQMVELMLGRDRFCCDLRPLFYQILEGSAGETTRGVECHPYDVAGALVAKEAGVILTDGFGQPLDCLLNVDQGMHWCGYANESLRRTIEPVIMSWLAEHGIAPKCSTASRNVSTVSSTKNPEIGKLDQR